MNNASFAPVGPTVQDQAKQFKLADIARIVATVNRILKALGSLLLLPDDTNEKELADRLNSIAGQLGPDPSDPDSQATTESSHRADVVTPSDVNPLAAMDNNGEVAQLRLQLSQTRQQLTVERQRNALDRERLFVGSVDRMIEQGRLTPADRTSIVEAGRSAGFALSLLKPFERIAPESAFPTQRLASRQAQVKEPAIGNGGAMTDERARELARRFAD